LRRVQQGRNPDHWRPMPDVGQGVAEIIIDTGDAFRVFYVAKFDDAIYVLHAFQKTTQKTDNSDIELGKKRYRQVVANIKARRVKSRKERRS
jgi:phage-related protein